MENELPIIKIEGHSDLIRCPKTGAIINTAVNEYQRFVEKKNKEKAQLNRIQYLEYQVDELKSMVKKLIELQSSK